MRISVIAVGRLRPPYQDDVEHYRKMLAGHVKVELIEVRGDEKVPPRIPERAVGAQGDSRVGDGVAQL